MVEQWPRIEVAGEDLLFTCAWTRKQNEGTWVVNLRTGSLMLSSDSLVQLSSTIQSIFKFLKQNHQLTQTHEPMLRE